MKTVKVTIELPAGPHCTGCPCSNLFVVEGSFGYGCQLLHKQLKSGGEFNNFAFKDKDCPALNVKR